MIQKCNQEKNLNTSITCKQNKKTPKPTTGGKLNQPIFFSDQALRVVTSSGDMFYYIDVFKDLAEDLDIHRCPKPILSSAHNSKE